uniref:Putative salivary lipocalin n=1 Tax=Ornithodoros turicata TaxID=34597 RepID=A0A2R5L7W2_9ACAR
MTKLATFLTACLLLCAVHGKPGYKKETECKRGSVTKVLAALQKETYYLTGTTNTTREPCYFLSSQGLNGMPVSGTPVMYGYIRGDGERVYITEGVAEQKDEKFQKKRRFPSNLGGPLKGKKVAIQGHNCFVLYLKDEIELWVENPIVDTSTCCSWTFDKLRKERQYKTTYEHGVC